MADFPSSPARGESTPVAHEVPASVLPGETVAASAERSELEKRAEKEIGRIGDREYSRSGMCVLFDRKGGEDRGDRYADMGNEVWKTVRVGCLL